MPKYQPKITIENNDVAKVQQLSNLIQNTVNVVEHNDLILLLSKVQRDPGLVKKALRFI